MALAALLAPASSASAACPNEAIRAKQGSTYLGDCRAYELVTPGNFNGKPVASTGTSNFEGSKFAIPSMLDEGNTYAWATQFAGIPDTESNGYVNFYLAERTEDGWRNVRKGPSAVEAQGPEPLNLTPDGDYYQFLVNGYRYGSLALCDACSPLYTQHPDGTYHLLGEGTVPTTSDSDYYNNGFQDDLSPTPMWMSPDGSHQIFSSNVQLTPQALPSGAASASIYDRTPTELKLVSLLPGDVLPSTSLESKFAGVSVDGTVVLFVNDGTLYARVENRETIEISSGTFGQSEVDLSGGVDDDGSRAFFVKEGSIHFYDFPAGEVKDVVTTGDAILSHVSRDGSHVFFISETELVPGEGTTGSPNFYVWENGSIHFIGTVMPEDVIRGLDPTFGLGTWTAPLGSPVTNAPAERRFLQRNTIRSTSDGSVIVFEATAKLTSYPNEGHREVYRYDLDQDQLTCVSCSLFQPAATGDSELVRTGSEHPSDEAGPNPLDWNIDSANLSADGSQVVFESYADLLPEDINGIRDVYEWHNGLLSLVSTGHSPRPAALFGASPSGRDIFFETAEKLVTHGQTSGQYAIYDARVGGGFAEEGPPVCLGEACLGKPASPPGLDSPASSTLSGSKNVKPRCRAIKRRARRHHRAHRATKKAKKKPCRPARRRTGR
ncbi:MAG TPA: hypothetical protein VN732_11005 [Solirubrobacterales bacterium]|nr:hypothetical protein [Solirubrobacterales bacterium]